MSRLYELPKLPYGYQDLAPYISEEQLKIHHQKHHQAYVNGANALMQKLDQARKDNADLDMKALTKEMSFHLGGHELHSTFWMNLAPPNNGGGGRPQGVLGDAVQKEWGSFERFKKEFTQVAQSVEGSGWAVLTYCNGSERLGILQVEKHNVNFPVGFPLLMCLDVWEHAYYLDYKNDRAKFVEAFWNLVNWKTVNQWFEALKPAIAGVA
ncbi:MAG: superoxide dismutase [Chloroflexi bacterium]|nr:superoxide dismutase [Chloroflexota bacterium]